jgi:hypothetical protein
MNHFSEERIAIRRLETERAFRTLGLSKRAARGLVRAGVLGPGALARAPWTDQEAGARFSSLSWRLSVDPECDTKTLAEVARVRAQLMEQREAS